MKKFFVTLAVALAIRLVQFSVLSSIAALALWAVVPAEHWDGWKLMALRLTAAQVVVYLATRSGRLLLTSWRSEL